MLNVLSRHLTGYRIMHSRKRNIWNLYISKSEFCFQGSVHTLKALEVLNNEGPFTTWWWVVFFVDKCLPFGVSISCAHFQRVSNAIAHLVSFRTGKKLVNYLDDFLFIAFLKWLCDNHLWTFLEICESIQFPIWEEKTVFADTMIIFLGFLINAVNRIIAIPKEKVTRAINMINFVLEKTKKARSKCKITVYQVQRICGFLNFLGRAIIPSRAFARRLYSHLQNHNLKPHHHIRVTDEMVLDLETWREFLKTPQVYCRPFMDLSKIWSTAEELEFCSDTSRNFDLGFGAYCQKSWMAYQWPPELKILNPSIQYLELYALTAAVIAWVHRFQNKRSVFSQTTKPLSKWSITLHQAAKIVLLWSEYWYFIRWWTMLEYLPNLFPWSATKSQIPWADYNSKI